MPKDEEEKYFERKQAEWREEVRREKRLQALQQREQKGIEEALNTSQEVAQEALDLGFDQETARVLPLVPLIEMAWADGNVSAAEEEKVRGLAEQFGLEPEGEAFEFLQLMLDERPSDVFFERVRRVVRHLLETDSDRWEEESLVEQVKDVAAASGGFFGLTDPINEEEHEMLEEFAELFAVEDKSGDVLADSNGSGD